MTEQTETTTSQDASLDAIAFAGATLAPFFLNDPRTGDAADAFAALAELDVEAAAAEWPFVDAVEAAADLALMREGLVAGADNEELVWEYLRLFGGPGHRPAPPDVYKRQARGGRCAGARAGHPRTWAGLNRWCGSSAPRPARTGAGIHRG